MEPLFWISYVGLWVLSLALLGGLFLLYRHIGHGLITSTEGRTRQGPKHDTHLPRAQLRDLNGAAFTLGGAKPRPTLVLFTAPTCEPCRKLLGPLAEFVVAHADAIEFVLLCRGNEADVRAFLGPLPAAVRVVPDRQWKLGQALHIDATPFAFIVDEEGIVRGRGIPGRRQDLDWFSEQLPVNAARIHEVDFLPVLATESSEGSSI